MCLVWVGVWIGGWVCLAWAGVGGRMGVCVGVVHCGYIRVGPVCGWVCPSVEVGGGCVCAHTDSVR